MRLTRLDRLQIMSVAAQISGDDIDRFTNWCIVLEAYLAYGAAESRNIHFPPLARAEGNVVALYDEDGVPFKSP